jgi:hypothetical protein
MCYSGKCIWEQSSGDCGFPTIKEVREKYPNPVCEIGDETEEEILRTKEMIEDVKRIVNEYKNNNAWK